MFFRDQYSSLVDGGVLLRSGQLGAGAQNPAAEENLLEPEKSSPDVIPLVISQR